jgi:Zn ribbon nucleic-acid-binding protein
MVTHEPCPRCLSRDNLGRWEDGHAWCFGCGYREPPRRTISNSIRKEEFNTDDGGLWGGDPPVYSIPNVPFRWIKQYGITNKEIEEFKLAWQPRRERLVLPFYENGEVVFFQGRNFKEDQPKYVTYGKRTQFHIFDKKGDSDSLIFVEDYISAIKVSRVTAAYPLLGAHIPDSLLERARRRFETLGVWLDADKLKEASRAVLRGSMMGLKMFRIYSPKDPKEYSTNEIIELIEHSINSKNIL